MSEDEKRDLIDSVANANELLALTEAELDELERLDGMADRAQWWRSWRVSLSLRRDKLREDS